MSKNKSMFVGNYSSCSGNMETYLVSKAFQVLEPTIKGKTIDLTHDRNNKSHGVIKRMENINDKFDPGHTIQETLRKANRHFEEFSRDLTKLTKKEIFIKSALN